MQKLVSVVMVCLISFMGNVMADEKPDLALIQEKIESNIPNLNIESITKSEMPGVYEILSSGQLLYVSEDAKYLLSGKLFSIEKGVRDLTAESMQRIDRLKAPIRKNKLEAVGEKNMIVFKAPEEKYRVTVFTDVDCSYCRKLHKEMDAYNKLGITVQYMGFPRAGLGSPSHKKLQSVWCAEDPVDAMNKAKVDRVFGNDTCDDPLTEHYKLVREFGLTGTPALILKSGQLVSGYTQARKLLAIVQEDEMILAKQE